jgi:microcin C transport system substrate-binding protein
LSIRVHFTRRHFLAGGMAAAAMPLLPAGRAFAAPETGKALYGLSTFGDLKYPEGFSHFEYASPDAPQGGTFNFQVPNWFFNQSPLSFNTLNTWVPRGDAPPRIEITHDTLMTGSLDEPDSLYGLLAESITISEDRNSFTFRMRPEARFHDGTPVTAEDAAYTFNILKEKGHPQLQLPLLEMVEAVADGPDLRVTFSGKQSPTTVFSVAGYPVLSKAWFEANPFDGSQLNAPLGNGNYKVGRFSAGNFIEYEKVEDYWGRDLGVNRGLNHFQTIRVEFYRDRQAGFEAFKKGDILFRQEFTARVWATEYEFPALRENKVVKREFPSEKRPSMQAWAMNQRRERFRDPRVREAINLCFDFEWSNRNLFYDAYARAESTFEKSEFKAEGMPSPEELALLEPLRADIPEAAFGEALKMPVSDGSGRDRNNFRRARELFGEMGWTPRDGMLRNDKGETFGLELLVQDEVFVRVYSPFVENMRAVGIDASIRLVDPAQYQARQADFDYDMVGMAQSFTGTPTRSQLNNSFGSDAADVGSSRNYPGTKSTAVDALIEIAGQAETRAELVTAIRALDRVLRARRDWIPNWYAATHRAAFWDMFGFREPKPDYGWPVEALWWRDEEKAKAIGKA